MKNTTIMNYLEELKWQYENKKIELDYADEKELERINGALLVLELVISKFNDQ